jgi:hypothetical protein
LDKLEKKTESTRDPPVGDPVRTEAPNHDPGIRTVAATVSPCPRLHHCHCSTCSLHRHRPLPCEVIKGARRTQASPFSPPSPLHHPALCCRPAYLQAPHQCQLSPPASRPSWPIPELWYSVEQLPNLATGRLDHRSLLPLLVPLCPDCHRHREHCSVSFQCPCPQIGPWNYA